ncbi:MAG: hypothetical protein ACKO0V_24395, partial [bacterium]
MILAGLAMVVASGQRGLAVDIFNSFTGETPNYSSSIPLSSGDLFAQQIETVSANTVIDTLSLALGNSVLGSAGTFDISIYTSVADAPGTLVSGSRQSGLSATTLPDAAAINAPQTYSGLNINLPTAAKYFVVLNNFSGVGFSLLWAQTVTNANPYPNLIWGLNSGNTGFVNGTANVGTNPFLLRVSTANVPEPSTWAMMTIAA